MPVLPAVPSTIGAAGLEGAAPDRILDDEQRRPVLDGLTGVHEFGLAQDGAAGFLGRALELDQGRAAHRCGHAVDDGHEA